MTGYELFDAMEQTWIGQTIKESLWYFPAIEAVHLLGLAMLGGAILVVDLRMLGVGLTGQSIAGIARSAQRWLLTAIVVLLATGIPLFLSEAVKCYYNTSFWVKMTALAIGLVFTFTVRNRVALAGTASTAVYRSVAAFSLTVWFVVAAAGRWIGFS
ncbi:MAG: DUF6644 family protein [Pseudomonadales bacterium]